MVPAIDKKVVERFQSLIGKIKTPMEIAEKFLDYLFQSLIGKIKTQVGFTNATSDGYNFNPS